MARIDVSELMVDPDFVDTVSIFTRVPTVNSFGEMTLQESCIQTVGSVQPASGRVIQRLPESLRVANLSSFWIKGKLTATAPGKYTDILVFKGYRYQIQTIFDWSNWGEGYCEGVCVAEVIAP